MSAIIFFGLIGLASASGIELNGFRVKFGWSESMKDKEHFFTIPKNVIEADKYGFTVESGIPVDYGLQIRCLDRDPKLCPLYDAAGTIAGIHIAIPASNLVKVPYDLSTKMRLKTINGKEYWTSAQYVVSPDVLKNGGRKGPIKSTVQDGIWVENGIETFKIPLDEESLAKTLFKKQNCIPNMGTHYYYNMTEQLECKNLYPYFVLVKEKQVIGTGFQLIGHVEQDNGRHWFEITSSKVGESVMPSAPKCLGDWVTDHGIIIMHIYYIEEPWNIKCEESDSLTKLSFTDKLLINTSQYASKAIDSAKSIFTG